ncbi:50S ribosomal protein L32 [Candidatus Poribacteria bacterium]|nr:50S ribosomal protein L32 [Candidatus Poribacteria bacterium]
MANPKRRHSHTRTRLRRAHDAIRGTTLILCRQCGERHRPHRACPGCGYFKAHKWHRPIVSVDVE